MDLRAQSYGRNINLILRDQIILIEGDSGTGKTLVLYTMCLKIKT